MSNNISNWILEIMEYSSFDDRRCGIYCGNCKRYVAQSFYDRVTVKERHLDTLESFMNAFRHKITKYCPHCGFNMNNPPIAIKYGKTKQLPQNIHNSSTVTLRKYEEF